MERVPPVLFLSDGQSTYTSDKFLRWPVKLKKKIVQLCVPCVLFHYVPSVALLLNSMFSLERV